MVMDAERYQFYSILFYSILFYSILFWGALFIFNICMRSKQL